MRVPNEVDLQIINHLHCHVHGVEGMLASLNFIAYNLEEFPNGMDRFLSVDGEQQLNCAQYNSWWCMILRKWLCQCAYHRNQNIVFLWKSHREKDVQLSKPTTGVVTKQWKMFCMNNTNDCYSWAYSIFTFSWWIWTWKLSWHWW